MTKRYDGRKPEELRSVHMEVGVVERATGSAMVKLGKTTAVAAVYGPKIFHPKRLQKSDRAVLRCYYNMVPFSTTERVRPGPSRRSKEISMVTTAALESVVFLEEFPKAGIDVNIDIIQADAGTRTAGINAASLALADAGVPMRSLVSAVACGLVDGKVMVDICGEEEKTTACDLPVGYADKDKKIVLLQLDGDIAQNDLKKVLEGAVKACEFLCEKQKEALRKKWTHIKE